jgi:hypothetical protein
MHSTAAAIADAARAVHTTTVTPWIHINVLRTDRMTLLCAFLACRSVEEPSFFQRLLQSNGAVQQRNS